ncbi:ferredoxin [Rhodococcus sp. NPDC127530]|uniref:ferredoxin n=1 Tax=unclassified Rhodococcus (in: high G+C Gram-positive bacteria) TaxID=192944 RepID=UPI003639EA65
MKIEVRRDVCVGYASCMVIASDVFDVDDDNLVVVLDDDPDRERLVVVQQAARSCPKSAITVTDD